MVHYQDCCESVLIEDVVGDIEDLIGSPILRAEERSNGARDVEHGIEEWTFYTISTINGTVDLRCYGTSNGYYSTSVSFELVDYHDDAYQDCLASGVYEVETQDGRAWWLWDQTSWRDFSGEVLDTWQARDRFDVIGPVLRRE
jgi:hypothetical protein